MESKESKKREIKDYVLNITRGLVTLKDTHLSMIMEIATREDETYKITLYRYDYQRKEWETMRTTYSTPEKALKVIAKHGLKGTEGFYRWDIYDDKGDLVKQIHSVNSHLF